VLETGRRNFQLNGAPNLPLVIKPAAHGSSIGLSIVKKEEGIPAAVEEAFRFDDKVVVEEYLKGRELTCGILNEQSLPVIEIIPKREFFDYEAKYQPGLTDYVVPARIEKDVAKRVQDAALSAHKLLGCYGCSRVDMILKDGLPYILEVNSIPGLTSNSLLPKAAKNAGIEFPDLCFKLIELAYEKK
jgi:D-alanine-D-alanine ligase